MNNIIKILKTNAGILLNSRHDNNERYQSFVMKNTKILKELSVSDITDVINHENFENNFSLTYLIDELIKDNKNKIAEELVLNNYDKLSVDSFNLITISAIVSDNYDIGFIKNLVKDDKIRKYYLEGSVTGYCVSKSKNDVIEEFSKISSFNLLGRNNCNILDAIIGDKPEILKIMLEYNKNKFKDNSNRLFKYALGNSGIEIIKAIINDTNVNLKKYKDQSDVLFSFKENSDKNKIEYLFNHKKFIKVFDAKSLQGWFSEEDIQKFIMNKKKIKSNVKCHK